MYGLFFDPSRRNERAKKVKSFFFSVRHSVMEFCGQAEELLHMFLVV
jgi:hypothetical protein